MSISNDIVNSIFSDDSKSKIVDEIMDGISMKVNDLIQSKKTEVFAKEMIPSLGEEE
jgi:hypothetical protein